MAVAAIALTAALGCVDRSPVAPSADRLIVQAVLDAGARDQYVVVQQTDGAIAHQRAVEGATVTLALPDGQVLAATAEHDSTRAERDADEPPVGTVYHVALGANALVPGATYQLRIVTPDGRVVTGTTTIPSAAPVPDVGLDTLPFSLQDTLALAWQRVRGASSYEVHVLTLGLQFSVFADTSVVLTLASLVRQSNATHLAFCDRSELVVSAVDANYYDYYRHKPDSFTGSGVISHLDGAIGVFGSIVEIERRALNVGLGKCLPTPAPM